jgi:hypothetical protein
MPLKREVYEETALRVTHFTSDIQTKIHTSQGDEAFALVAFFSQ